MQKIPIKCPSCGSYVWSSVGLIPANDTFAGRRLYKPLSGGALYQCKRCYLSFRHPTMEKILLTKLYTEGKEDSWISPQNIRKDWAIAKRWMNEVLPQNAMVLDIGCFDGGFLAFLNGKIRSFGCEINLEARSRAEKRGVEIIESDFDDLSSCPVSFDCVTAIDIIEHAENPAKFIQECYTILRQKGYMIISTGNTDAPSFRAMGARYWYCTVAEHLCFINPLWTEWIAKKLGLEILKQCNFSHGRRTVVCWIKELLKNSLYMTLPRLTGYLRRKGLGGKNARDIDVLAEFPPCWMSSKDHFITLFRKI